jgi:hypothetical protein
MRNILSNHRPLTYLSVAAILFGLLVAQLPSLRGLAAVPTALPILTVCDSANIPVPSEAMPLGVGITFTATSTGCTTPEYKFMLMAPGTSTWVVKREYGSAQYTWSTAGVKEGVWQIGVWARETGSESRYQAWAISTVTVFTPVCSASTISVNVGPVLAGTTVVLFATSIPSCLAHFEFWEMAPGAGTWTLVQAYSTGLVDRYSWNTTGLRRGGYRFAVWARYQLSTAKYESYSMLTVWING